ncbi:MAG: hypothetical protein V1826_00630 [bacterium]
MEDYKQQYSWVIKFAIFAVALLIVAILALKGSFFEGLLKLFGVGASQLQTITLTSNEDFLGTNTQAPWMAQIPGGIDNTPTLSDAAPFSYFTGQTDPGETPGFVMPLWFGGSSAVQVTQPSSYTAPIIDLGSELSADAVIQSIEALDYRPAGSDITYSYRTATSATEITDSAWQTLEMGSVETVGTHTRYQAVLGIAANRFVQVKVGFGSFFATDRPMVSEIKITYGTQDVVISGGSADNDNSAAGDQQLQTPDCEPADLNCDGAINSVDYSMFLEEFAGQSGDGSAADSNPPSEDSNPDSQPDEEPPAS